MGCGLIGFQDMVYDIGNALKYKIANFRCNKTHISRLDCHG